MFAIVHTYSISKIRARQSTDWSLSDDSFLGLGKILIGYYQMTHL